MSDLPPNPSEPQPPRAFEPKSLTSRPPPPGRLDTLLGGVDRVARLQTIAAVVLGLALIAIPLYLWRRPRSEAPPVTSALTASPSALDAGVSDAAVPPPASGPTVSLSDPKVMECHDTGSHRTRPEECDHLVVIEKGLAAAITASASCLPTSAGGGTLVYVVDASFGRKRHPIELMVPRDGRSLNNAHGAAAAMAVSGCMASVRNRLDGVSLDGAPHAHARYKIAITATYAASNAPPP